MPLNSKEKKLVKTLRLKGYGYKKIATTLGTGRDNVRQVCKSQGLEGHIAFADESMPKKYKCKSCGKEYYRKDSDIKSVIYCSNECKLKIAAERKAKTKSKKVSICPTCGKEFIKVGGRIYCSEACNYETRACEICGKEFKCRHNSNKKCCSRKCSSKHLKLSHEEYYERFSKIFKGEIVPITIYEGLNHDMTVYCLKCKQTTTRAAGEFVEKKVGCKNCGKRLSLGEDEIENLLIKNGTGYIKQFRISNPNKENSFLRYDFALIGRDQNVLKFIEYDGRQHFEPVKDFGGDKAFETQKLNDISKEAYAKENGIELVRITYKEKSNIESRIKEILNIT